MPEAVGPTMALRPNADANAGYGVDDAIALGRLLEPFDLQLLEQPVADGIVTDKLDITRGELALPGGPGLGVVLDEEKLARYAVPVAAG